MVENRTNCGVYEIRNTLNNKVYVGSSVNLKSRKYIHFWQLKNDNHDNKYLQNAYNKIKEQQGELEVSRYFEFRVIVYTEKIEDKKLLKSILLKLEQDEIDKYKVENESIDHDKCYNINSFANNALNGDYSKNPIKGKKRSIEFRERMKIAGKNYNNFLGKKHTEETKNKISASQKGNSYNLGRKHTEEAKQKMALVKGKKVINLDTDEIFNSMEKAAKVYNISSRCISNACRGKCKTAGGYRWRYMDE